MTESELPIFPFATPAELDAEPEYAELRRENPVPKVRLPAVDASEVEWKSGMLTRGPITLPVTW